MRESRTGRANLDTKKELSDLVELKPLPPDNVVLEASDAKTVEDPIAQISEFTALNLLPIDGDHPSEEAFEDPQNSPSPNLSSPTAGTSSDPSAEGDNALDEFPITPDTSEPVPNWDPIEPVLPEEPQPAGAPGHNADLQMLPEAQTQDEPLLAPEPESPPPPTSLASVKQYSEELAKKTFAGDTIAFSLRIEGALTAAERGRLIDLISTHELGLRELDLEPQFLHNQILIPQISEYAGVHIVQSLKSTRARITLGPAEQIYPAKAPENAPLAAENDTGLIPTVSSSLALAAISPHPAESIPLTEADALPQFPNASAGDTLIVQANLPAKEVDNLTPHYKETLAALKLQLSYQAYARGAQGLVHFRVQLHPLIQRSAYHLRLSACTIRSVTSDEIPETHKSLKR